MSQLTRNSSVAAVLQLGLLAYSYADPATRVLPAWLYLGLLVANSLRLVWLAYRAFQAQRPVVGVVAAVLAFPGLVAGIAVGVTAAAFRQAKR